MSPARTDASSSSVPKDSASRTQVRLACAGESSRSAMRGAYAWRVVRPALLPSELRRAEVEGTLRVVAEGDLLSSPLTGVRALVFRWEFFTETTDERGQPIETLVDSVERRTSFALVDRAGRRARCAADAPVHIVLAPVAALPVERTLPEDMRFIEARASGSLVYREQFLLPDTEVRFVGEVGVAPEVVGAGYRAAATPGLAVIHASEIIEVPPPNVGPWYSRLANAVHALISAFDRMRS